MVINKYGSFIYNGSEAIFGLGSSGSDGQTSGSGNDSLYGYGGDDSFESNAGNDSLYGGDGNDSLHGGKDNDTLEGVSGNDFLRGGDGNDYLYGGEDNDRLDGDAGDDYLSGGDGNDTLIGDGNDETGSDVLYGRAGNDDLKGKAGNDYLHGGEDNDYVSGDTGNDRLYGETGNDTLDGYIGNDTLDGGSGNDYLNGHGYTRITDAQFDWLTGGAGSDTFVLGETGRVLYNETGDGYAVIQDWDPKFNGMDGEFDRIQLAGNVGQYKLQFASVSGIGGSAKDTEIFYKINASWERIGIVQDSTNVNLNRDFVFV